MALINNKLTTAGKKINANSMVSGAADYIQFTKLAIGDGYTSQSLETMTNLIHTIATLNINVSVTDTNKVKVKGVFNNSTITENFYYRELGLYAIDKVTGEEVLYAYGNAGDVAELIMASSQSAVVEKEISLIITIDNANTVVMSINSGVYALQKDLEEVSSQLGEKVSKTKADITYYVSDGI